MYLFLLFFFCRNENKDNGAKKFLIRKEMQHKTPQFLSTYAIENIFFACVNVCTFVCMYVCVINNNNCSDFQIPEFFLIFCLLFCRSVNSPFHSGFSYNLRLFSLSRYFCFFFCKGLRFFHPWHLLKIKGRQCWN